MSVKTFPEVKKMLGFGCMRLPMDGDKIDIEQFKKMVDVFMANGFNYFDTAHIYHDGESEKAIREAVSSRYPRESFILTDKLTTNCFNKQEDIRPLFKQQLKDSGVDYFDFYLMHSQDAAIYEKFRRCNAYETALEMQKEGKFRHFGISFHDKAEVLEQILKDYPQIEAVQIQFNYLDYGDPAVDSKRVYEVCEKYGKAVIVMEPVKGGNLVNLPEKAQGILDSLNSGMSNASYAIRFAASFPNMFMVLSGMSDLAQINDNMSYMKDFKPLDEKEMQAVNDVRKAFSEINLIPCTACHYCTSGCPMNISIPELFSCYNHKVNFHDWNQGYYYAQITRDGGKPSECIECGQCEGICPQHLEIIRLLKDVSGEFEKK
jgi:predicted aldo/keto reductase-like oxidoreductase